MDYSLVVGATTYYTERQELLTVVTIYKVTL
jgi:hypothetical protein